VKCIEQVRFEVFTAVKILVEVFWVLTPCGVAVGYQCFGGPCCLHFQEALNLCWTDSENRLQRSRKFI